MNNTRTQASLGLLFWSLAAMAFLLLFFSGGGPDALAEQSSRVLMTSIAYGAGFLIHIVLMIRFHARTAGRMTVRDEWDDEVARKANGVALIVTLIFVYTTGVVLWEVYRQDLNAPIGWFWFFAYVSVMVGFISHAAATLSIHLSRDRDD